MPQTNASIWPEGPVPELIRASFSEAEPRAYWFSTTGQRYSAWRGAVPAADPTEPELPHDCDLAIVGGGLTGLWAAILAKERAPDRDVILLEGERIAFGASGRNGGFISSSITHGIANGMSRAPDEMPLLERLGRENLEQTVASLDRYGIECDLALEGALSVALTEGEAAELDEETAELQHLGHEAETLDAEATRALVNSPTYRGAVWQKSGEGLVNPVKLCLGLADAARSLGVRVVEGVQVTGIEGGERLRLSLYSATGPASLEARRVFLATAAFPGLVPAIRRRIVPVYDYVLVTEPLNEEQRRAVGWQRMIGVSDRGNQFHYYRPLPDGCILWGGYDAIYNFGNGLGPDHDLREETFARLAVNFFHTFPQLEGLRFSHRWGGPIDTCSRFAAFYGTAFNGQASYAVGHTGLGVGASRFAAGVGLDLLDGRASEATGLSFIRSKPMPFPPEPLRWAVIEATRNRLAAADRNGGRRGLWLRLLDHLGLGFDS